jgi:hypothetical protein
MIILWTAIASLSLAWLAGDAVLGLIVAPRLFTLAAEQGAGTAFAGLVFGEVLGRWVVVAGLVCVIPMAVMLAAAAGRRLRRLGWKAAALPLLAIVLVMAAHTMTASIVKLGQRTAAALREHPDAEGLARFRGEFHVRIRLVMGLEMLTALGLAIGAGVAAQRCRAGELTTRG